MTARFRAAVDIGGTFTDLQLLDLTSGETHAHKVPTTPDDPSEGLVRGLSELAARLDVPTGAIDRLMHGTTIATNAVIMRRLPAGALVTTAGFEDVLEIGRHERREIYANKAEPRTLLIPRDRRFGLAERVRADGRVEIAPSEEAIETLIERIVAAQVEAVAIGLLHAYANPEHERLLARRLGERLPDLAISLSHEVSPEIREFERLSTTVMNALLVPVVRDYLRRLDRRLEEQGIACPVFLVQSNGGVTSPQTAARYPARLLLSGPSGGALAAETIARQSGERDLIAVDMGGTSYDVSVVHEGAVRLVTQGEVAGCPVRLPMIDIRTIGAGGGSLARIDTVGRLAVGPESAGAVPGPVCYGRGGSIPAVSDANVALGRIDPGHFLGGAMPLDREAAERAIETHVARPAALEPAAAAAGILQVVTAQMAAAIRLSLFEKGLDPSDFALVSFGGAGGLHACETAEELGARRVLFPREPGTLSAWGMLYSDIVHDLARSRLLNADDEGAAELATLVAELRDAGTALLEADGIPAEARDLPLTLDMRYPGQAYEIQVPYVPGDGLPAAVAAFHARHLAQFAHSEPDICPQIVTVRLAATGRLEKPADWQAASATAGAPARERRVHVGDAWQSVAVHERDTLATGAVLIGPLVVEEAHATLFVPPGWRLAPLPGGELLATREE